MGLWCFAAEGNCKVGSGDLLSKRGLCSGCSDWGADLCASMQGGENGAIIIGAQAHLAACEAEQAQRVLLIVILISSIFCQRTKACLTEADGRGREVAALLWGEATASKQHRLQMLAWAPSWRVASIESHGHLLLSLAKHVPAWIIMHSWDLRSAWMCVTCIQL